MSHPQVLASERGETSDVVALISRLAVAFKMAEHGCLAPLGAIEARGQR